MSDNTTQETGKLSPWWRQAILLVLLAGFTVLIVVAILTYRNAPPIPAKVVGPAGEVVFTGEDIRAGGIPQVRADGKRHHLGTRRLPGA